MQIKRLCCFAIFSCFLTAKSIASVDIILNGTLYQYPESPRLAQVLTPIATQQSWYWPASKAFEINSAPLREEYFEVLASLDSLIASSMGNRQTRESLVALKAQTDQWFLGKRLKREINFDRARLFFEDSPAFPDGTYRIYLTPRPTTVEVFGVTASVTQLEHATHYTAADYVKAAKPKSSADPDWVYVISLSGEIQKVGINYWNMDYRPIEPGSAIYAPLKELAIKPDIEAFNRAFVELAVNRMPK